MCNWYCKVEPTFHFLHYFSTLIIEFFFPELSNLLSKIVRKQWDDSDEYSFLGDTSLDRASNTQCKWNCNYWLHPKLTFTCSKSTIETLEKVVKYFQSLQ